MTQGEQAISFVSSQTAGISHTTQPHSPRDYRIIQNQAAQLQRQHLNWTLFMIHLFPLEITKRPVGDRSKQDSRIFWYILFISLSTKVYVYACTCTHMLTNTNISYRINEIYTLPPKLCKWYEIGLYNEINKNLISNSFT